MAIAFSVSITGPSARLTIDAVGASRIFNTSTALTGAAITFANIVLTGGSASTNGGAIQAGDESITLDTVALRGNSSGASGGGIGFTGSGASIGLSILNSEISA